VGRRTRRVATGLLALLVAFALCASSGCSSPSDPSKMDAKQIEELMLTYLREKYGEEFVSTEINRHGGLLEGPKGWTMLAHRVGGQKKLSDFSVVWNQIEYGTEIEDSYLLVKMRPLFLDEIEEGLASVLPEFVAQYKLSVIERKSVDSFDFLPGTISEEDFRVWAARNIKATIEVATPMEAGITEEEFVARMAPLVKSGNKFGVARVSLEVFVFLPDDFVDEPWSSPLFYEKSAGGGPCFGPASSGQRVFPGGFCVLDVRSQLTKDFEW